MGGGRITTNTTTASNTTPKKVMVVVDPTRESAAALQYSLSHAVIDCDEVILLHVDNPNSWKNAITTFLKRPNGGPANTATPTDNAASDAGGGGPMDVDFLKEMKKVCKVARPELNVRTARVELEGKDKAAMIMAQTKALDIDLLVIGQRRSLSTAILGFVFFPSSKYRRNILHIFFFLTSKLILGFNPFRLSILLFFIGF